MISRLRLRRQIDFRQIRTAICGALARLLAPPRRDLGVDLSSAPFICVAAMSSGYPPCLSRVCKFFASFSKSMLERSTRPPASSPSMMGAVIAMPSIFSSKSASIFADTAEMSTGPSFPRSASARTCSVATGLRYGAARSSGSNRVRCLFRSAQCQSCKAATKSPSSTQTIK